MKRLALLVLAIGGGLLLPLVGLGLGLGATLVQATAQTDPSALASADLPPVVIRADVDAAASCIGLPWQLLAAVNLIADPTFVAHLDRESGEIAPPVFGATTNSAGGAQTLGPMGFAPSTWAAAATVYPGAPKGASPDPQNEYAAIFTLADVLCALRLSNGDLEDTLAAYDASPAGVQQIWALAIDFGMNADGTPGTSAISSSGTASGTAPATSSTPPTGGVTYPITLPSGLTFAGSGAALVAAAETELGVPYVWGGITAHVGLDCSGLIVVSMEALGLNLLWSFRTSEEQATLGTTVSVGDLRLGDLLFFVGDDTSGPTVLGHVAIYVGHGEMIQAPETGEVVSFAPVPWDAIEIARRVLT